MTIEELKRLREVCEKATPGEWTRSGVTVEKLEIASYGRGPSGLYHIASINHRNSKYREHDAEFIAEARTAMPKLLDELQVALTMAEELEKIILRLQSDLQAEKTNNLELNKDVIKYSAEATYWKEEYERLALKYQTNVTKLEKMNEEAYFECAQIAVNFVSESNPDVDTGVLYQRIVRSRPIRVG